MRLAIVNMLIFFFLLMASPVRADLTSGISAYEQKNYKIAFDNLLPLAVAGNPHIQNFIGFMLHHGEGVAKNDVEAHQWFHKAAEQGHIEAMRNLGVLHSKGGVNIPQNFTEASLWFLKISEAEEQAVDGLDPAYGQAEAQHKMLPKQLEPVLKNADNLSEVGEKTFATFCSGCHGFTGIAAYPMAPSVAFGDRMYKDDTALLQSVLEGKGRMPSWRNKLPEQVIAKAVGYMRALAIQFRQTKRLSKPKIPNFMFRFRPVGENGDMWWPSPYQ